MTALILIVTTGTLILVHFAYFHSIMSCRVLFWGKSTDIKRTFSIKRKITRLMAGVKKRVFWMELFKKLNTLPLAIKTFQNGEGNIERTKVQ